jgi:hypothetical protein
MGYEITSDVELGRLLDGLAHDIIDAHLHYKMHNDLIEALNAAPVVRRESNSFWYMTLSAHIRLSQALLTRAYDQERQSLHLKSWLTVIRDNLEMFSEASFRERMTDNPHVESLAEHYRIPDLTELERDIAACSDTDPLVHVLILHRNALGAHRSSKFTAKGKKISDKFPLTFENFDKLLKRSLQILNRYSTLFAATSHSTTMIGHKDFQSIFAAVEEKDARMTAEHRAILDRLEAQRSEGSPIATEWP